MIGNPYEFYSQDPAERAKSGLCHYFQLAGVELDNDKASEIGQIVDEIIHAVESRGGGAAGVGES